jgi:hypothetical protein
MHYNLIDLERALERADALQDMCDVMYDPTELMPDVLILAHAYRTTFSALNSMENLRHDNWIRAMQAEGRLDDIQALLSRQEDEKFI